MFSIDRGAGTADYSLAKPKVGAPKRKVALYCLNCSTTIYIVDILRLNQLL